MEKCSQRSEYRGSGSHPEMGHSQTLVHRGTKIRQNRHFYNRIFSKMFFRFWCLLGRVKKGKQKTMKNEKHKRESHAKISHSCPPVYRGPKIEFSQGKSSFLRWELFDFFFWRQLGRLKNEKEEKPRKTEKRKKGKMEKMKKWKNEENEEWFKNCEISEDVSGFGLHTQNPRRFSGFAVVVVILILSWELANESQ